MRILYSFSRALLWALLLLLAAPAAWSQAPDWQMAMTMGGNVSEVKATATDGAGNVYIAGAFGGTVNFGNISLTSQGVNFDAFVAKWNPASNSFVWAQRAGGSGVERINGIAVEGSSVYVVGDFSSSPALFGSVRLTNTSTTTGFLAVDIFIAKLLDAGNSASFVWAKQAGSSDQFDHDASSAVVASGTSVYIAGVASAAAVFGTLTLVRPSMFVAKLTDAGSSGSFTWVQPAGGHDAEDVATALALNGANLYVTGYFFNGADFGSIALTSTNPCVSCRDRDMFVAKLVDNGSTSGFAWANRTRGLATAIDVAGTNIYLAGAFEGTTNFGSTVLTAAGLGSTGDMFVAKLSDSGSSGNFLWAKSAGSAYHDFATGIKANGTSVYVTGWFSGFDIAIGTTTLLSVGRRNVFVAKLTDAGATGRFAWAQRAGGSDTEQESNLAVYGDDIYVGGYSLSRTVDFNGHIITNTAPMGYQVGFFASLHDGLVTATALASTLQFSLFPNPAHNRAILQLPAFPGTPTAALTLLDALGRSVRTQSTATNANANAELDLTGLPAGLYAVRVQAGGSTATRRLVVE